MNRLERYFRMCLDAEYEEAENSASFAFLREGRSFFILFQHSHGKTDWQNNLDFHAVPYEGMDPIWQCHGGFLRVWNSAKPYVRERLDREVKQGIGSVKVIGYSHGAALAVLCHEFVWYRYPSLRRELYGYGYGCPRVFYGCPPPSVAKRWDHFSVIRNLDDPVTHLPPRLLGYCHVGKILEIGEYGKYPGVDAHRPENYLEAMHSANNSTE